MNEKPERIVSRTSVHARLGAWADWWLAPRWRALITWVVLAFLSACVIESGVRSSMDSVARWVSMMLTSLIAYTPPAWILEMSSVFAAASWFQPLCLRLGVLRSALYILIYVIVGLIILPGRSFIDSEPLHDAMLLAPMLGLPGLVAIGIRTRPMLSFPAAALSILAGFLFWTRDGSLTSALLLANLPYAVAMLYGTRLVDRHARNDRS
jgi:hypothetical protein